MQKAFPKPLLENVIVLVLLGVLAGGLAALALGTIQKKASTPSSAGR